MGREGSIESQQKFDFFCSDIMPYRWVDYISSAYLYLFPKQTKNTGLFSAKIINLSGNCDKNVKKFPVFKNG